MTIEIPISITQEANNSSCHLLKNIGMHHIETFKRFNADQYLYEITQHAWHIKED